MDLSDETKRRFRWPVSVSRAIDATPQAIWETISRPGNLNDCHPFCEHNPVVSWPGVGAKDTIYYYSGWVLHREIVRWIEGVGYDLKIGREGGRESFVSWRIAGDQDNTSSLQITIYPQALQSVPLAVRWFPHTLFLRPALHSYLESVIKGFEWFITTRKPVSKDQFGSHKWFSRKNS